MTPTARISQRTRDIGREIFELADAAQPRITEPAWWLERMVRLADSDPTLRTRAFEFVDCLPSLKTNEQIVQHISEYFDPRFVDLPRWIHAVVQPGPLRSLCADVIGFGARFGATRMAGRFITGHDVPSVVKTLERLRSANMTFTLDVLGEFTSSYDQADRYAQTYHDLMDQLADMARAWPERHRLDRDAEGPMPRMNFSIKLTGLDPHFGGVDADRAMDRVGERLRPLLRHARRAGAFLNVDMESFKYRDLTLALFKRVCSEDEFRDFADVGIVVQAYLKDAEQDLENLLKWRRERGCAFAIRLVKGAYWDAETAAAVRAYRDPPVWTRKWESDACYERMTCTLLEHAEEIRPCFASHNVRSIAVAIATAEQLGVSKDRYEIQMLYGMGDPLKTAMANLGQCLRVYCPYGDLMPGMGYLIRRLLENTSNEGFMKQDFLDRSVHERLLADPTIARPPSAPLPTRYYVNTDPEEPMSTFTNVANTNFALAENRERMTGAIDFVRGELGRSFPLWIGGESVTTDEWFVSHNPSCPAETIGQVAMASEAHVDQAVSAARRAFSSWRLTSAATRANFLRQAADRLAMRRFELAATMVLEVGKPWCESDADVTEAIDHCRYYADQIECIEARPRVRNIPGENNRLVYSPKGVAAVIAPWSFPLAILTGMSAAALAAGNTIVIKPARQASVLAAKFVETLVAVGFPPGVVNYVPGDGSVVGHRLVAHDDVNLVAFTGSREVGTRVLETGSRATTNQGFIRKMIVEMGGKNAIIVDDDADLDGAVQAIIESAFSFAGQKCSSCSRLIVVQTVFDELLRRLAEAAQSLVIGPADQPATTVGPVIDADARQRLTEAVKAAGQDARVLCEVPLPEPCGAGFFVAPTILTDVRPDSPIAQEEVLGPILATIRARDFDEALTIANDTRYALTGGLFSRSPAHIERACRDFAVGNLYINRKITGSQVDVQPFGGFKLSGTGVKAGSPDYLRHFMDARCVTENTQRSGLVPDEARMEIGKDRQT